MYLLASAGFSRRTPNRVLTNVVWLLSLIGIAWNVMFVIWEATTWANCNDGGNTLLPAHPECLNRKYPLEQQADWTFIIMVVAGGVLWAPMFIAFWIVQQIMNTDMAKASLDAQGELEILDDDDEAYGISEHIAARRHHRQPRGANGQYVSDIGHHIHEHRDE